MRISFRNITSAALTLAVVLFFLSQLNLNVEAPHSVIVFYTVTVTITTTSTSETTTTTTTETSSSTSTKTITDLAFTTLDYYSDYYPPKDEDKRDDVLDIAMMITLAGGFAGGWLFSSTLLSGRPGLPFDSKDLGAFMESWEETVKRIPMSGELSGKTADALKGAKAGKKVRANDLDITLRGDEKLKDEFFKELNERFHARTGRDLGLANGQKRGIIYRGFGEPMNAPKEGFPGDPDFERIYDKGGGVKKELLVRNPKTGKYEFMPLPDKYTLGPLPTEEGLRKYVQYGIRTAYTEGDLIKAAGRALPTAEQLGLVSPLEAARIRSGLTAGRVDTAKEVLARFGSLTPSEAEAMVGSAVGAVRPGLGARAAGGVAGLGAGVFGDAVGRGIDDALRVSDQGKQWGRDHPGFFTGLDKYAQEAGRGIESAWNAVEPIDPLRGFGRPGTEKMPSMWERAGSGIDAGVDYVSAPIRERGAANIKWTVDELGGLHTTRWRDAEGVLRDYPKRPSLSDSEIQDLLSPWTWKEGHSPKWVPSQGK